MTRDPLELLRAADPAPRPVAYSEDEVQRRIAEILDRDGELFASIGAASMRPTRSRWLPAALVAAAVLVVAVVSAVVFTRGDGGRPAAGAAPVTCAVSTSGGAKATAARLEQAEVAIADRLRGLGGSAHSFVPDADDGIIGFTPHGVTVAKAGQACRASTVAIRPLVAPTVNADTRVPRSADPLSGLTFTVPSTDVGYGRLTVTQRAHLATAMSHYNCASPAAPSPAAPSPAAPTTTAPTTTGLACSTVGGSTRVLLLGPALITGADVRSAGAEAPNTGAGGSNAAWTVALSFRAAGAARFQVFTAAHHTSSTTASSSVCGPTGEVPCGDFLAITVNGRVQSVPVTDAVLQSKVSVSGAYDEASAQLLAGECTAAAVQLRPR